ncbi:MAG TPA: DUF5522 domain-containing protein [Blastocatellia bacterium]|nr:DUF5522 domain-containing protein [Blastocatellia bacterium]
MSDRSGEPRKPLVEGEDYYLENGLLVFTAAYHLKRGYCCHSGCRHCPYGDSADERATGAETPAEAKEDPIEWDG